MSTCPTCGHDDLEPPRDPHDAHVVAASRLFRAAGVTLAAMQYPRPPEALAALRRANGAPDHVVEPLPWRYFPNAWCRDQWTATQGYRP